MDIEYLESHVSQAEEKYDELFEHASKLATVLDEHPDTEYEAPENLKSDTDIKFSEKFAELHMRTSAAFTTDKWIKVKTKLSSLPNNFKVYKDNTEKEFVPKAEYNNLYSRKETLEHKQRELSEQLKEISTALNRNIGEEISYTRQTFSFDPGRPPNKPSEKSELDIEGQDIEALLEEKKEDIEKKVERIRTYQDYQNTLIQIDSGMADDEKVGSNLSENLREDQMERAASKITENWSDLVKIFETIEEEYQSFEDHWALYEQGKVTGTDIRELYNLEPSKQKFKDIRAERDWLYSEVRDLTEDLIIARENSPNDKVEPMNQIEELEI